MTSRAAACHNQHVECRIAGQVFCGITQCDGVADNVIEQTFFDMSENLNLTPREKEILLLVASGKTNKEIAHSLCRVERTVEYHRNRLMHKLGARNITDLLKKAVSMGIMAR